MEKEKILIIEDDLDIRKGLKILLENQKYIVDEAENGKEGIAKLDETFSLVILDVVMPGISGIETCKKIREKSYVPILFLTARSSDLDKLEGLSAGGDDYLIKPFSYIELLARIQALLRRHLIYDKDNNVLMNNETKWMDRADIEICTAYNNVRYMGETVELTEKEYRILLLLISYPTKVFSVENIFESVWEEPYVYTSSNTVMVHIKNLRNKLQKINDKSRIIKTVWGKGYRFEE